MALEDLEAEDLAERLFAFRDTLSGEMYSADREGEDGGEVA